MSKNAKNTLKKNKKKSDTIETEKNTATEEIKNEQEYINKQDLTILFDDKIKQIDERLESVESGSNLLKEMIASFSEKCQNLTETSDISEKIENFETVLKVFEKKLNDIFAQKSSINNNFSLLKSDEEILHQFKEELTFFQNELENRLNANSDGVENIVNTLVSELNEKITDLQETIDKCSENQINTVISDIKQLKADVVEVADNIRHINVNAILRTEEKTDRIIDAAQKTEQTLIAELNALSSITAKSSLLDEKAKETVSILRNEIIVLKNHIFTQIKEVLSQFSVQGDIKLLAEDTLSRLRANSTETEIIRKNLKFLKMEDERHAALCSEIREILSDLSEYELNENADKIDIIYENLALLNTWVENFDKLSSDFIKLKEAFNLNSSKVDVIYESSDKLTLGFGELREDFDLNSDKIDIIYENISYLNEWVKALNKFSEDIEIIKKQCYADATVPEKIKEIYENLSVVKDWGKKADALSLQVKALSVQIDETESTINSKNLSDMKKMFAQMNEDMANVSARTNKLIIESDKQNEVMKEHIFNLQEIIALLEQKSEDFGFEKITDSLETLESRSVKSSEFETGMTESFIYLADWIDKAGNVLNTVKNQLTLLDEIREQQDLQIKKASDDWDIEKSVLEKILNFQNETTQEIKDIVSENQQEVIENISEIKKTLDGFLEKQDNQSKLILNVSEELSDGFKKLENTDLLIKTEKHSKEFSAFSSKINEEFNMFQLQQEYALGQLQKLILQHGEQNQEIDAQKQILVDYKQFCTEQNQEIVNQFRQLLENYFKTIENIEKAQEDNDAKFMQLSVGLQGAIQQILKNQAEILAKQEEILAEGQNTAQKLEKDNDVESRIDTKYNLIQNSYAEINENLHTIADLIAQNEQNSQQRMLQLSYEKVDDSVDKDDEIKELLNHIAEQNEIIVEKTAETEMLSEKINSLEVKLSSLEQYMGKLIEYLEED